MGLARRDLNAGAAALRCVVEELKLCVPQNDGIDIREERQKIVFSHRRIAPGLGRSSLRGPPDKPLRMRFRETQKKQKMKAWITGPRNPYFINVFGRGGAIRTPDPLRPRQILAFARIRLFPMASVSSRCGEPVEPY